MVRFTFKSLPGQPFTSEPTVSTANGDLFISACELFLRICDQGSCDANKRAQTNLCCWEQFNFTWINPCLVSVLYIQP